MKRKELADKARAKTVFGMLLTERADDIRGGTALAMMLEIIRAHRDKRNPEPGAIVYWGTMFDAWIMDPEERTLDELLELTGTKGRSPIRVEYKRDMRNMLYLENMGLLLGAGFTVDEAAELIVKKGDGEFVVNKFGTELLFKPRALIELFEKYGGTAWAREAGFFADDPAIKARRDELLKRIPVELLPARLR
jgi:hypothetical protein